VLFLQFHNDDQGIHPYKHHGGKYPLPFRGLLHLTILKILSENSMRGIDVKKRIKEIFGLYTLYSRILRREDSFTRNGIKVKMVPRLKHTQLQVRELNTLKKKLVP
jgi:hypothetical protein